MIIIFFVIVPYVHRCCVLVKNFVYVFKNDACAYVMCLTGDKVKRKSFAYGIATFGCVSIRNVKLPFQCIKSCYFSIRNTRHCVNFACCLSCLCFRICCWVALEKFVSFIFIFFTCVAFVNFKSVWQNNKNILFPIFVITNNTVALNLCFWGCHQRIAI